MPSRFKRQTVVLNILGVVYLLFSIFALVNVYTFWKLGGGAPLSYVVYALLYASLAALFFTRQRWLLPFFAVNLLANLGALVFRSYAAQAVSWLPVIIVAINALLVWYLYVTYRGLRDSFAGRLMGAAAFVLWAAMIYTVINNL